MSRKFDIGEVAGLSYTRPPPCITVIFRVFGRILCHGNVVEGAVDEIDRKSLGMSDLYFVQEGSTSLP